MITKTKFPLGQVVITQGAIGLKINLMFYLERHANGDWGDISENDKKENEYALDKPLRILSAYETYDGRIWIITEADRSVTTILLPEEY